MRKRTKIIIGCCLALFYFFCVIPILNRVFVLNVKYNVEGHSIDCSQACAISLCGFDGVKSCWGYCINFPNEKIYFGVDFDGLSYVSLKDGCDVGGDFVRLYYDLEFPEKTMHRFWKETVYLNFENDDEGHIYGTVNTSHHIQYPDNKLRITDEVQLLDKVIQLDSNQTFVTLKF